MDKARITEDPPPQKNPSSLDLLPLRLPDTYPPKQFLYQKRVHGLRLTSGLLLVGISGLFKDAGVREGEVAGFGAWQATEPTDF